MRAFDSQDDHTFPFEERPETPRTEGQASDFSLEDLLGAVIEREGVPISVAPAPRRRVVRPPVVQRTIVRVRSSVPVRAEPVEEVPAELRAAICQEMGAVEDPVSQLDLELLRHVHRPRNPHARKRVEIRFTPHATSEHLLKFEGEARKIVTETNELFGSTIRYWQAPYETPPSLEQFLVDAKDLWIDEVDPQCVIEQFTPGDPDVAYAEQYGWWSKLRRPFIRWEAVSRPASSRGQVVANVEEVIVSQALDDQFTDPDPDKAYSASYGWWSRFKNWFRSRRLEIETVEEVAVAPICDDAAIVTTETWDVPVLVPRLDIRRVMMGFVSLLLLVSVPALAVSFVRSLRSSVDQVTSQSFAALEQVKTAIGAKDQGADSWGQASTGFQTAQQSLSRVNTLAIATANALPQTRGVYKSVSALLLAGQKASQAGQLLAQGFDRSLRLAARHPDERLITFGTYLDTAAPYLDEAVTALNEVQSEKLPTEVRPRVDELKTALTQSQGVLRDLRTLNQFAVKAVGHDQARTYLLVFQNHTELRPTGGFMGSMAEVVVDRGALEHLFVPGGGPYDFRNQLLARVAPPAPLQLVGKRWEFQDANWFPDFPTAAKKIRWFWSKSGQPTLDGVIAVNATIMEKLLAVTGPIEMPEYGKTISAENFLLETQKSVELEYDKAENKPKKFVGDLMQKLLERVKSAPPEEMVAYLALFADALETKDIQIAMSREDEDEIVQSLGWSGRMESSVGDALAIVEANIAGLKTDAVIDERATLSAEIGEDGSIVDTVTLERTHRGVKGELFRGGNNVSYVRMYVPQGAELLSAEGFEAPDPALFERPEPDEAVDPDMEELVKVRPSPVPGVDVTDEFGRTAFGAWVQLKPGETATVKLSYRLPFTVQSLARSISETQGTSASARAAYIVKLGSQSGKPNRTIETRVDVPESWRMTWENKVTGLKVSDADTFTGSWDRDRVIARLYEIPHDAQALTTSVGQAP
ncbi:MAG: DUF4012 domain-containing protein [Patescibacteria group bacterium]